MLMFYQVIAYARGASVAPTGPIASLGLDKLFARFRRKLTVEDILQAHRRQEINDLELVWLLPAAESDSES